MVLDHFGLAYDPWNSLYWVKEMEDAGFTLEKVRQGIYSLSEPMKQLEADLKNKLVNYNNHPNDEVEPCKYPS